MIFSNNVALDDEKNLKAIAEHKGLLVMGPDCGTAIINGIGLGFANSVPRGRIGIVAASGTGAQEVSSILARLGVGISQLIGTGGRDLSRSIGGVTTRMGLDALIRDETTDAIVLISKLPDDEVAGAILEIAKRSGKPTIIYFAGSQERRSEANLHFTPTLTETALKAAQVVTGKDFTSRLSTGDETNEHFRRLLEALPASRIYLRGLFTGGTLAQEALFIIGPSLGNINTNMHLTDFSLLKDPTTSLDHTVIDLGDDVFTRGRPHPMIDQTFRLARLHKELSDPQTAVILLDVVLGYGCNMDPAGEIVATIRSHLGKDRLGEGDPVVIASVCGTPGDPQNYELQKQKLKAAGIIVAETNAFACELALSALMRKGNG